MDPLNSYTNTQVKPRTFRWGTLGLGAILFVVLSVGSIAAYNAISGIRIPGPGGGSISSTCNVLGINIHGDILTYIPPESTDADGEIIEDILGSEDVVASIDMASRDDSIKAILLDIDSVGGYPVAAEEIVSALKASKKPTVSVIRQSGISAAYWVATGTDKIYASRNSDVGSIGVTMSYLRNINQPGQYIELASGKFKDTGDPDKPLSAEEREILMRDVQIIHQNFVEVVALNRRLSIEKVQSIADGSSVLGAKAKELGLIDEIGSWTEATEYLKGRIGEEVEICWQ